MIVATITIALLGAQTVTFTHPCARADVVLAALGKELGQTLEPSGSVVNDFFLVSFADVPVTEALEKIATTLNATWEDRDGKKLLSRTKAQELAEQREVTAADAKLIEDWLAKREIKEEYTAAYAKKLIDGILPYLKPDTNGSNYSLFEAANQDSPLARLLTRLVKEIGPANIVDVGETGEQRYGIGGGLGQKAFPNGQAMRLFEQENEVHKQVFEQMSGLLAGLNETYYSSLISPYKNKFFGAEETRLTVTKRPGYFMLALNVNGVGTEQSSITMVPRDGSSMPNELVRQEGEYQPTPMEKELSQVVLAVFGGGGAPPNVSNEVATVLTNPVDNEPLSIYGSPWILESTKKLGRNAVVVLSDEASWVAIATMAMGRSTFSQLWTMLPTMERGYVATLDDKWLTLRPADRSKTRSDRVNREQWRTVIRSYRGKPSSLEQYGAYAALSENDTLVMLSMVPAVVTGQDIDLEMLQRSDSINVFRLYGRLTAGQQASARRGGVEFQVSSLPEPLANCARTIAFSSGGRIVPESRSSIWENASLYSVSEKNVDPVTALARGVPAGSRMRVSVIGQRLYYPKPSDQFRNVNGMTAEDLGSQKAWAEVGPPQDFGRDFNFIAVGDAEQIVVEFEFTGLGFLTRRAQLDRVNKNTVFMRIDELPAADRDKVSEAYRKAMERYKNRGGTGGGGGTP